jgi:hypothetical protein
MQTKTQHLSESEACRKYKQSQVPEVIKFTIQQVASLGLFCSCFCFGAGNRTQDLRMLSICKTTELHPSPEPWALLKSSAELQKTQSFQEIL